METFPRKKGVKETEFISKGQEGRLIARRVVKQYIYTKLYDDCCEPSCWWTSYADKKY